MKRQESERARTSATRRPHHKTPFAKPGNQLYPIPAVMVSCCDPDSGKPNIFTVAWTGTICSDPPMVSISVRRERYSFGLIEKSGEFVINLTTEKLAPAADFCGVRSGRDVDKFQTLGLTPGKGHIVQAPTVEESPVSIECKVTQSIDLGSHVMFLAEVVCVQADEAYMDERGTFHLEDAHPIAYSHGTYYALGHPLGQFGFSVMKEKTKRKKQGNTNKMADTGKSHRQKNSRSGKKTKARNNASGRRTRTQSGKPSRKSSGKPSGASSPAPSNRNRRREK